MGIVMKKLLIYIKDYKKECILGPLFKLLEAGFDLIVPLVTAAIIDHGIAESDSGYIMRYGGVLALLAAVGLLCSATAQYFAAKAAVGFSANLRHALFAHIESLSFSEIDEIGTSTLITRMTSDINQVQAGVNMALRLFLRSPFIVAGSVILAFLMDAQAAIVFVVVVALLMATVFGIMAVSMPLHKKVQGALDRVLGSTRENLTGVRVIRAFHREREEEEEFEQENNFLAYMQQLVGKISALTNPVTYVLINLALVVLLWTGGVRINAGFLSQGKVVAMINYLTQILIELVKFANTIILANKALACASRVESVFEIHSSLGEGLAEQEEKNNFGDEGGRKARGKGFSGTSPSGAGRDVAGEKMRETSGGTASEVLQKTDKDVAGEKSGGQVIFKRAALRYRGASEPSIEGVDFTAEPGQTIGIIGGTGSGKSSLVHLIPRFYDATEGEVLVDGKNVREIPIDVLRKKIGIVMQKPVLFHGTIRENLLWGNEEADEEALKEALILSQSMEFVEKKERGMDTEVAQGGRNLSGGQRQRLSIARALVRRPEILILDDSTSALDYATDARLRQSLKGLSYHPTVFIVSQRTSSLRHADLILALDDGKVVGMGTHGELLETCKLYHEIHYSQFQKEEMKDGK